MNREKIKSMKTFSLKTRRTLETSKTAHRQNDSTAPSDLSQKSPEKLVESIKKSATLTHAVGAEKERKALKYYELKSDGRQESEIIEVMGAEQIAPQKSGQSKKSVIQLPLSVRYPDIIDKKEQRIESLRKNLAKQRAAKNIEECTFKPNLFTSKGAKSPSKNQAKANLTGQENLQKNSE